MKKIEKILEEIKRIDKKWFEYKEVADIRDTDTLNLLNEIITEIRGMLKEDRDKELEELEKYVENDILCRDMIGFSGYTLRHFYAWKLVTNLEKENEEMVPFLLQNIMEKAVLRIDYEFVDTYAMYGAENRDVFVELLNSCDTLVTYYVQKHLSRKAIISDIKEETEIGNESAEWFADLIEKNYRELQINIILDKLEETQL